MDYFLRAAGGAVLEARVTIENGSVTLHSRSGKAKSASRGSRGRNPDYVAAFDGILDRLASSPLAIDRILLDSSQAHLVPEEQRVLATRDELEKGVLKEVKNSIRSRMRAFGRSDNMPVNEGNQNKKVKIETSLPDREIVRRLSVVPIPKAVSSASTTSAAPPPAAASAVTPLPAATLRKVEREHILSALDRLSSGDPVARFDPSRDYDVMTGDGRKYAPKKVFGLALEAALGIEAMPGHFNVGWGTPCFDILEKCGLWIVPKSGAAKRPRPTQSELSNASSDLTPTDEERTWIEGNPRIAIHLKKERQPGLAAKKREAYLLEHGKLTCEKCGLDPAESYGEDAGSACIEVHHHRTHVAEMQPGHETSLADLKCLCANCHRVLHRALSLGVPFDV